MSVHQTKSSCIFSYWSNNFHKCPGTSSVYRSLFGIRRFENLRQLEKTINNSRICMSCRRKLDRFGNLKSIY